MQPPAQPDRVPEPAAAPPVNQLQPPTGDAGIDHEVRELVQRWGVDHSPELVEEMIGTVLRMARDRLSVADLKLYNRSLKELRYAARMWQPYATVRKVTIFGSARTPADAPAAQAAHRFAGKMRDAGYMIVTGGGDGIMGAAQLGAGRAHSFGLNIRLPFEQQPNVTIDGDRKLVNFNYFFTRKLNFMKESHALALFPGGLGTLDEGFEALTLLQTGKAKLIPVVMVDEPGGEYWKTWLAFMRQNLLKNGLISESDFNLFRVTEDVDAAVAEILRILSDLPVEPLPGSADDRAACAPADGRGRREIERRFRRHATDRALRPERGVAAGEKRARDRAPAAVDLHAAPERLRPDAATHQRDQRLRN